MDGLLGFQTSRDIWPKPIQSTIHQFGQQTLAPQHPEPLSDVLKRFEAEMAEYKRECAAQLEKLGRLYVISKDGLVAEFLNDHRVLPQILIQAEPHLRKYFPEAILTLRATWDEYGWDNLYVSVLWQGDARDAFRLLDQFGDDWWIANSRPARGTLTFTYRLV